MEETNVLTNLVTQLGVGGIFALLILREVFSFLRTRKLKNNVCAPALSMSREEFVNLSHQITDLHNWHNQKDSDGVPVWYVRRSLENAIEKLAENIGAQTTVLQGLCSGVRDVTRDVADIKKRVVQ